MKNKEDIKIIVADDEYQEHEWDKRFKKNLVDFNFIWTSQSSEVLNLLENNPDTKILLLDLKFKNQELQGMDLLKTISSSRFNQIPIIIFTVDDSLKTYLDISKVANIHDYIVKYNINFDEISEIFYDAADNEQNPYDLKGTSKNIRDVRKLIRLYSNTDKLTDSPTVLILGDTGTGKELVAKSIHRMSRIRKNHPFEARNIAEFPSELIASELFGHKKGSFTGADYTKKGAFELAKGGVLFLDEIGELPAHLQVKLLRVLQEKKIYPVGSEDYIDVSDVRVITATNIDIPSSMKSGKLRKDLFYRLNGCRIELISLNERLEDIDVLVKYFILKYHNLNRIIENLGNEVIKKMKNFNWEGNVRQLEKMIESAMILSNMYSTNVLEIDHFPDLLNPPLFSSTYEIDDFKKSLFKIAKDIWREILNGKRPISTLDDIDKEFQITLGSLVGIEAIKHFGGWLNQDQEKKFFGYEPSKSKSSRHLVSYFRRRGITSDKDILKQ
jgi:transcriptional regulator with PAS, ATPase and Fis domain